MRVAVIGAGAVGGLLGALLHKAGHTVSFVAQGKSQAAVRESGITVTTASGSFTTGPLKAETEAAALGFQDLVILGSKSWQVSEIAPTLKPLLEENTLVIPTQNGVEAAAQLAKVLGEKVVLGGICHVIASREGPGKVKYVGLAPELTLGERAGGLSPRLEGLAPLLRAAGITTTLNPTIEVALWQKLLFVEAFGSVGAVSRSSIDLVRKTPETRAMLEAAMRETQGVAIARGIPVPEEAITNSLKRVDALPAGATSSMHRDLLEGRESELNEQTGAVVRLGKEVKVATPIHDFLYAALLPQERKARGK
jgi:2-dehydropantoate 2-reductase